MYIHIYIYIYRLHTLLFIGNKSKLNFWSILVPARCPLDSVENQGYTDILCIYIYICVYTYCISIWYAVYNIRFANNEIQVSCSPFPRNCWGHLGVTWAICAVRASAKSTRCTCRWGLSSGCELTDEVFCMAQVASSIEALVIWMIISVRKSSVHFPGWSITERSRPVPLVLLVTSFITLATGDWKQQVHSHPEK